MCLDGVCLSYWIWIGEVLSREGDRLGRQSWMESIGEKGVGEMVVCIVERKKTFYHLPRVTGTLEGEWLWSVDRWINTCFLPSYPSLITVPVIHSERARQEREVALCLPSCPPTFFTSRRMLPSDTFTPTLLLSPPHQLFGAAATTFEAILVIHTVTIPSLLYILFTLINTV